MFDWSLSWNTRKTDRPTEGHAPRWGTKRKLQKNFQTSGYTSSLPADGNFAVSPATTTTYILTATGPGGTATSSVLVTVNAPSSEALVITQFEFRAGKNEWRIAGTSSIPGPGNTMTLYVGPTVTGTVLGMAAVDELGAWEYREKESAVLPDNPMTISIQSSQGGIWEGILGTGPVPGGDPLAPPAPTVDSFTASATVITVGQSATLNWLTTNADSVPILGGASLPADGGSTVSPITTTTYVLTATGPGGSVNASVTITVNPAPLPAVDSFLATPATITAGQSATLSWTTTNADSVSIDGGASLPADGNFAVSPVTTTTYVLTATGPGGFETASVTITVNPAPLPAVDSFVATPATITAGQSATLSWTTTNADSVSIDSGASLPADGSSTVSPITTTTYVLTATGPGGFVTASVTITVNPAPLPPVAAAATPSSGAAPLTVIFNSAGSFDPDGTIATFACNFGDGTPVSSEANPTHIYADPGAFTAVLTVTDNTGASATASVAIAATAPAPPAPPNFTLKTFELAGSVLSVEIRDAVADAPVTIDGVGRGAIDGGGRYKNDIGGFSSATCEVTVQVGDSSTQATPTGCVLSTPPPSNLPPSAAAAATPSSGETPLSVAFSSAGSFDPDGAIVAFAWNFGDGATSTVPNPTHVYADAGSFTAILTVTDTAGAPVAIAATAPSSNLVPVASATATPSSGFTPLTVAFGSAGSFDPDGTIVAFAWDFRDGSVSDQANPTHTYSTADNFLVLLTVTDNQGASTVTVVTVMVAPPSSVNLASITFSPATVTGGGTATGTLTFDGITDGACVTLENSRPDVVTVPSRSCVSGNQSSGVFPVTTVAVISAIEATITGTVFGVTRTGTLTVSPGDPPPADSVQIQRAEFNRGDLAGILFVTATSTNPEAIMGVYTAPGDAFIFTLTNFGGGVFEGEFGSRIGFDRITVRSNFGGFTTVDVVQN